MLMVQLTVLSAAMADSGDSGICGFYWVDATYVDGECVNDSMTPYCERYWYGQCPTWDYMLVNAEYWELFVCEDGGEHVYKAYGSDGEANSAGLFFGEDYTIRGAKLHYEQGYYCCDGSYTQEYISGDVDCENRRPLFPDTGDSAADSPADSASPGSETVDSGTPPPRSSCGCSGRNSATAAVFGLLLLARRWLKR